MTPFPSIRIFCIYTGAAMTFTYIWHLTLFGGFLAIAGELERRNRHGFFCCMQVAPLSLSQNRSWTYRTFFTGGINPDDPLNPLDNKEHAGFAFFRDRLAIWLNKVWVKLAIIVVFIGYITGGEYNFVFGIYLLLYNSDLRFRCMGSDGYKGRPREEKYGQL